MVPVVERIGRIVFDVVGKTIEILTDDGHIVTLGFNRDIYFDATLKIAMIQRNGPVGHAEIRAILNNLKEKAKDFSPIRRKEYGSMSPRSFETYWQQHFRHKGDRQSTPIIKNPSNLPYDRIRDDILPGVFAGKGRGETAIFRLGDDQTAVILPKPVYEGHIQYVGSKESYLGQKKICFFTCIVDTVKGFQKKDIRISFLNERIRQWPEIEAYRAELLEKWRGNLLKRDSPIQPFQWPGPTFAVHSFNEDFSSGNRIIHLTLTPTDFFSFLATQEAIKNFVVKDQSGRPQKLGEKYYDHSPLFAIPELSQLIFGAILIICREGKTQYAILAKRSDIVATGQKVYVLSVCQLLRRKPNLEEMDFVKNLPPELIEPDIDKNGNPCLFQAIVRGARREIGVNLPIESIRILSFGLETERYFYFFIGIAETDLSVDQVRTAYLEAKEKPFQYSDMVFVPFTPKDIYEFMRTHRDWGPEAEVGLYQALVYKYGSEDLQKLFRYYPKAVLGISQSSES
jgi:hypothetical protein